MYGKLMQEGKRPIGEYGFITYRFILKLIERIGLYIQFLFNIAKTIIKTPPNPHLIIKQLYDIGVTSVPVVIITGFFTGLVLAAQCFYQLSDIGLSGITGVFVAKAMITELAPVLTAFMIVGRVGASICAEIGTMQVTEQIDALKTMAIHPNRYIIAPRVLSGTLIMPLLTIFTIVTGIFGGFLMAMYFFNMSYFDYFDPIPKEVTLFDLFTGMSKALIFGLLIMSIACYKGMKTSGGAAGVGRSITNSVVLSYCFILFVNFFLTLILNKIHNQFFYTSQ
jgi:phospholipid/cholesterol/gamma-HCH transport system permease protein